jgi:hypothetical protein
MHERSMKKFQRLCGNFNSALSSLKFENGAAQYSTFSFGTDFPTGRKFMKLEADSGCNLKASARERSNKFKSQPHVESSHYFSSA